MIYKIYVFKKLTIDTESRASQAATGHALQPVRRSGKSEAFALGRRRRRRLRLQRQRMAVGAAAAAAMDRTGAGTAGQERLFLSCTPRAGWRVQSGAELGCCAVADFITSQQGSAAGILAARIQMQVESGVNDP